MNDEIIWKEREIEILKLIAEGLTNSQIGVRLHLSHDTIRWHNKHIFEKLEVGNRTQAVKRAGELGLLTAQSHSPANQSIYKSAVQYAANRDIHIAYQVIGEGPVDLLFIHGFLSNLELAWEEPRFVDFFEQLGKFARVILFDKRGVGLSDRILSAPTIENTISDAICVLNAVGSKRTFVMGTSEGGAAAALLASTYTERVEGLILYASTPKLVRSGDEPHWAESAQNFNATIESLQASWGQPWAVKNFAPSLENNEPFKIWWAKILRASSSPSSIKQVMEVLRDIDIRLLLPQIYVPTLVAHKRGDRMVSVEAGRYIAKHMPNAQWAELDGEDHIYFVEPSTLIKRIENFLKSQQKKLPTETWIAVVLYIKVTNPQINQNKIESELNNQQARHSIFLQEGVLATFESPSRAIQCALNIKELINEQSLQISLHVGECNFITGKPSAPVIKMAEQAAELAPMGKVLITQTLYDILAGSGVVFDSRKIQFSQNKPEYSVLYTLA